MISWLIPGRSQPTAARAKALFVAGHFAWLQGDVRAFRTRLEECVEIQRRLGDVAGLGRALPFFGLACRRPPTAQQLAEEGVALPTGGRPLGPGAGPTNLGRTEATWGHDAAARPPLEEATALFRSLGDDWLRALPLTSIGAIAYRAVNYEEAQSAFEEALPCFQAIEDRRNTAQVLTNLGFATLARATSIRHSDLRRQPGLRPEHGDRSTRRPACEVSPPWRSRPEIASTPSASLPPRRSSPSRPGRPVARRTPGRSGEQRNRCGPASYNAPPCDAEASAQTRKGSTMAQAPAHAEALEAACRDWEALLGADAVLRAPDVLARYGRTTLPDAPSPSPSCGLRPSSRSRRSSGWRRRTGCRSTRSAEARTGAGATPARSPRARRSST